MKLEEINLSISSVCNANCIFCPTPQYPPGHEPFMSVDMVKLILEQINALGFRIKHDLKHSVIGENGEPFMNPQAIQILRLWRASRIFGQISLYTNFSLVTEEIAEAILSEHLCDVVHVNMDGASEETYRAAKGIPLHPAEANLKRFIELRSQQRIAKIKIVVHIITARTYIDAVHQKFGVFPQKRNSDGRMPEQDEEATKNKWWALLKSIDFVGAEDLMFWAERGNGLTPTYEGLSCPLLERVKHHAFINPMGDWYACCFDRDNLLGLGNIFADDIGKIAEGDIRKHFIRMLEEKRFRDIGLPCSRVDACQIISLDDLRR